jgi:hypothetical protein
MVDVTTSILISKAREAVAAYAADPARAPEWYVNIKRVEWKTPPPVRVGSRVAFVAHFLGRTLEYTYEIAELVPGRRLRMHTAEGPFPMETTYEWDSVGDHLTRMTLRNRGRPRGFSRLLTPFIVMAMRRANNKDLRRLKQVLETGSTGASSSR